ncbi:MAG: hypothetical protein ACE5GN_00250 [Waddliaceae bacterium]
MILTRTFKPEQIAAICDHTFLNRTESYRKEGANNWNKSFRRGQSGERAAVSLGYLCFAARRFYS